MILRYGKQLHKVIANAIEGDDASELGARIFDLSPNGCNLKIVVEKQGDYPTYVSSKFSFPSEVPGVDDEKIKTVMDNTYTLADTFSVKSYDELKQMVSEHIYCTSDTDDEPAVESVSVPTPVTTTPSEPVKVEATTAAVTENKEEDEEIKDLLAGLDL